MKVKKHRLFIVPLIAIASISGIMLSNLDNVEAANNYTCSAEYFVRNIIDKIDVIYNSDGTATLTNNSKFQLFFTYSVVNYASSFYPGQSVRLPAVTGGVVKFMLRDNLDAITNGCIAPANVEVGSISLNESALTANPLYYDSLCVNYRNTYGNDEMMKNAVQQCFQTQTYGSFTREQLASWIDTAIRFRNIINSSSGSSGETMDTTGYQYVDDVKNVGKLTCDAFSNNNYDTMHKYYHTDTTTSNKCKITCTEKVEVNFSDPVATQAGMCFQYLIEIKSKTVCEAAYQGEPPVKKSVCYPTPVCKSGSKSYDAGGPNEEFDMCVSDCDGGKYSQKCINKCYSEVYEGKGSTKKTSESTLTHDEVIKLSPLADAYDTFLEARQMANKCPGTDDATDLYNYMYKNPSGYYNGGTWYSDFGNDSICSLGPYYFRNVDATQKTINMWNGTESYSDDSGHYANNGNGILKELYDDGDTCDEECNWENLCDSNTALTQGQADAEYEKALEEYESAKMACEGKAATCNNETTKYQIVVDNLDGNDSKNDNDKSDWQEEFNSQQKLNSTNVTGEFPDMVILTDGDCEDGEDDPWNYHNIITFPGIWINNKTGQTAHSIQPGYEDFYTYAGNQYCTKFNSVPVNTAWYNWKVNQNGDPNALTDSEKQKITDSIDMNIRGSIDNYGYFGWNFDVECFYALYRDPATIPGSDPSDPSTPDDPGNPNTPTNDDDVPEGESPTTNYKFRTVALDNLFPSSVTPTSADNKDIEASNLINKVESLRGNGAMLVADDTREVGFNWTCAATNLENPDYLVQPVTTLNNIQALGDSIYEGNDYLDYHIRLTPETMNKIRDYNDKYDSYAQPTGNNSGEVLTAGNDKTSGITVYRSYLLHRVLNSSELLKSGIIGCNNEDKGTCPNVIDTSTACYNEYMAQSSVLKGAK